MAAVLTPLIAWALLVIASVLFADRSGPIGWAIAAAIVAVTTLLAARYLLRELVSPLDEIARLRGSGVAPGTSAELAATLSWEYRAAVDRLERAAHDSRRWEAALAYTSDAVVIVLHDGRVEYANPTARLFLQNRVLEVTGRLDQPDLQELVQRATAGALPVAEDVTLWVPGAKPARARAIPLADGATVLLLSDLTESYRLDRIRRDFVANVSHELKTPVAAIRALAETAATALRSDDRETAVRFVERLGTESTRLAQLVSDLLDLSRVEAGSELVLSDVDLHALMSEAADRARAVSEAKKIEILIHGTAIRVKGDAAQLAMAVKNLVDNAVRYSEGGKIEVLAERGTESVTITVADQGIGIPADELPRIFERFYRVDKGRSRVTGGTGLGLAIVRHVAENHGGRVDVESELGAGSRFVMTLPDPEAATSTDGSAA